MKGAKRYRVRVTETCVNWGVVEVEAQSQREAEEKAEDQFDSGEHDDGTVELDTLVLSQDGCSLAWSKEAERADPENPCRVVDEGRAELPSGRAVFETGNARIGSLGDLLAHLKQGDAIPLPPGEEWGQMVARISTPGQVAEIDEETFDYFLDVLPPRWMGPGGFAFGEGADRLRLFWRDRERGYYCRQLDENEHRTFCSLVGIPRTSG